MDYVRFYDVLDKVDLACDWFITLSMFLLIFTVIYFVYKFFNWLLF